MPPSLPDSSSLSQSFFYSRDPRTKCCCCSLWRSLFWLGWLVGGGGFALHLGVTWVLQLLRDFEEAMRREKTTNCTVWLLFKSVWEYIRGNKKTMVLCAFVSLQGKKEETNRAIEPTSICTYIKVRLTPKLPAPFRFRVPSHSITNKNNSGVSLSLSIYPWCRIRKGFSLKNNNNK
jgi:hypothetical protein